MNLIKMYWPYVVHGAVITIGWIDPSAVRAFAAAHPAYSTLLLAAYGELLHWKNSPAKQDANYQGVQKP